jgi:hypothetical protein
MWKLGIFPFSIVATNATFSTLGGNQPQLDNAYSKHLCRRCRRRYKMVVDNWFIHNHDDNHNLSLFLASGNLFVFYAA